MIINHETLLGWIDSIGYVGVFAIIFTETGLFFGFFLPGDSLLFLSGLLAARQLFHIGLLIFLLIVASFLGYVFAYWFGKRLGHWLLRLPDSFWYKKSYMDKAHAFYKGHGEKAILLGRMVPIVRTFCGIVAGIVHMRKGLFILYNLLGSILWVCLFTLLGYYLGDIFPGILDYMVLAVLVVIILSIGVPIIQDWRKRRNS